MNTNELDAVILQFSKLFKIVAINDAAENESYLKDLGATHVLVNLEEGFVFGYLKELPDRTVLGNPPLQLGV